ncbi:MAG: hypothetical protein AB1566_07860 [Chloroflexota bacterium]
MRTLSATLLAAQRSASGVPYFRVRAIEQVANVNRLRYTNYYAGSEESNRAAVAVFGDGSLVRMREATEALYWDRITNPGPGSVYSNWTSVGAAYNYPAICAAGANGERVFLTPDNARIYAERTTDNGATWVWDGELYYTGGAAIDHLAIAMKSDGTVLVIFNVGATVCRIKKSGGTWGAAAAWGNSVASVTGLAVLYSSDFNCVVTGTDAAGNSCVWGVIYGDGYSYGVDTWGPLQLMEKASSGSGVTFSYPAMLKCDVIHVFFRENFSGTGAYNRQMRTHLAAGDDFVNNRIREPMPFNWSASYGVAAAYGNGNAWLVSPARVWCAPGVPAYLDLTADVQRVLIEVTRFAGEARVELRNDDARYASPSGALSEGAQVEIDLGYKTTAGNEYSPGLCFWIDRFEWNRDPGRSRLEIVAGDIWHLLGKWRARRQHQWAAGDKNIFQLLAWVCARAGVRFTAYSYSSQVVNWYPSFTIAAGESAAVAIQRLLDKVTDEVLSVSGELVLVNPLDTDVSTYSYGGSHTILGARYGTRADTYNRFRVFGPASELGEAFSWGQIDYNGDRLLVLRDANLTAAADLADRATAMRREMEKLSEGGHILVPVNCGQELWDVIDVTDPYAGLSTAKRRVRGYIVDYDTSRKARYQERLFLGSP